MNRISNQEIREVLEKQLRLLSEHSSGTIEERDLVSLSAEIVRVAELLLSTALSSAEESSLAPESFGFSPYGYNQIIVFNNESDFKEIVAANPNMTAIMGADDHTKEKYPGVFIAGLLEHRPEDSMEVHRQATQIQV